jgi:hypothetical protein
MVVCPFRPFEIAELEELPFGEFDRWGQEQPTSDCVLQ